VVVVVHGSHSKVVVVVVVVDVHGSHSSVEAVVVVVVDVHGSHSSVEAVVVVVVDVHGSQTVEAVVVVVVVEAVHGSHASEVEDPAATAATRPATITAERILIVLVFLFEKIEKGEIS